MPASTVKSLETNMNTRFDELHNDILSLKNTVIENLLTENKRLRDKVDELENRATKAEREIYSADQYSRRNNIEINGIPNSVDDKHLETTVINLLNEIDVEVDTSGIEACHRLPSKTGSKTTIIKFVNRKVCEEAMKNKFKLSSCDKSAIGIGEDVNIYIYV